MSLYIGDVNRGVEFDLKEKIIETKDIYILDVVSTKLNNSRLAKTLKVLAGQNYILHMYLHITSTAPAPTTWPHSL